MAELPKILLTGAPGFIGSFLLQELKNNWSDSYEIHVLERYVTGRYANPGRSVQTHFVDLRDASAVRSTVKTIMPDIVIHLAAISPVSYSYDHASEVIESNLLGTINLVEACKSFAPHLKHFIAAGTTEEYGVTKERPAGEEARCVPNSPYSISKHAQSEFLQMMNLAYGFPTTIMRATNTYGRIDDRHFFIEKLLTQMIEKPTGEVFFDNDEAMRDFMYVHDHVSAYISVLSQPEISIGEIFNLSTHDTRKLNDVIKLMAKITDFRGELVKGSIPTRPLDIMDHRIRSDKARRILKWAPRWTLEEGLADLATIWSQKLSKQRYFDPNIDVKSK